jgi:hypothetical protein
MTSTWHSVLSEKWVRSRALTLFNVKRIRLPGQLRDIAVFVYRLSILVDLTLFKLHGFSTDDALWEPLTFGRLFGPLNVRHLMPPGRDNPNVSLVGL